MGPQNCRNSTIIGQGPIVHNNTVYTTQMSFNIMYTNADQLFNKFNELELLVQTKIPDIIAITEVKPKNNRYTPYVGELNLEGYTLWHTNIENEHGRGCIIYTLSNLNVRELRVKTHFTEFLLLEVFCKADAKLLVGCFYRSPNSGTENNQNLITLINEI